MTPSIPAAGRKGPSVTTRKPRAVASGSQIVVIDKSLAVQIGEDLSVQVGKRLRLQVAQPVCPPLTPGASARRAQGRRAGAKSAAHVFQPRELHPSLSGFDTASFSLRTNRDAFTQGPTTMGAATETQALDTVVLRGFPRPCARRRPPIVADVSRSKRLCDAMRLPTSEANTVEMQ